MRAGSPTRPRCNGSCTGSGRGGSRSCGCVVPAVEARRGLTVAAAPDLPDQLVHPQRHVVHVRDVLEDHGALLARGRDLQRAAADHPVQEALLEGDVVDPVQRDVPAVAAQDPVRVGEPLGGQRGVGAVSTTRAPATRRRSPPRRRTPPSPACRASRRTPLAGAIGQDHDQPTRAATQISMAPRRCFQCSCISRTIVSPGGEAGRQAGPCGHRPRRPQALLRAGSARPGQPPSRRPPARGRRARRGARA